ncbi:unnamed protein product [Diamesa serratosioi]
MSTAILHAGRNYMHQELILKQQQHNNHPHQTHQQQLIHNALTRAVSNPIAANVNNLFTSLNEIVNVGGTATDAINIAHRKLERTQSEPLPQINTSRYKTELCRPFEEAGECKYGDKCQFAHGMHELRNLQRHPKYKTELCRTFHSVGFCPYGPRCHFVHNAEEARNHNRNVAAYHARLAAQRQEQQNKMPLSPALSLSTGSDRASPVDSLSPSNTSMHFFSDQQAPSGLFSYPHSPPHSPNSGSSPTSSPPPIMQQQILLIPQAVADQTSAQLLVDDARLPVFNRMSSTMEVAFMQLAI